METIFDFINSLIFSKKKITINDENKTGYIPFMINRWCSFYSKDLANIVNQTVNKFTFFTKDEHYNFLYSFLPKVKFSKINYIKKKDKTATKEDENLAMLAKNLELSKREINHYILCQKYL